jgi:hypothetical protein
METPTDAKPVAVMTAEEEYLRLVESKTTSPLHARLLKAARESDALAAMNHELTNIALELTSET